MFGRITLRCWNLFLSIWQGWRKHDGTLLSAATAYYATLSLFPLCLVLLAIFGIFGRHSAYLQGQEKVILETVRTNISPWLAGQLGTVLGDVQAQAALGGPMGLLFLVLAAIGIFVQLENLFDRIWEVPEPAVKGWLSSLRLALWDRLLAFLTLLAIGAMLMGVFFADIVFTAVRSLVGQLPAGRSAWQIAQSLASIACDGLLLAIIYKVLPKVQVRWRDALGGGLVAAIVWSIGKYVLMSFVVGEKYSAYGILGAFIGLMFWFYYASTVVFLGAELVRALAPPPLPLDAPEEKRNDSGGIPIRRRIRRS
jgi:membrane protein